MLHIIKHPLIETKLTKMRSVETSHDEFRRNLNEIASLMVYEILRDYKTKPIKVRTPMTETIGQTFDNEIVIISILRAGLGMTEGILNLVPQARIGHIGMSRDEKTFEPKEYFYKTPQEINKKNSYVLVVDPMLATGGSAAAAITLLKEKGAKNIKLMCLVAAPEGVEAVNKEHPEVPIYVAALDEKLNDHGYILPGLGDAGDRIFGTK